MKNKNLIYIFSLMFFWFSCKNEKANPKQELKKIKETSSDITTQESKDDYLKDLILEELIGVYEYKGLYNKFSMVDCPDFIEFAKDSTYYIYNDCGMMSQNDTISEKGNYKYSFGDRILKLENRVFFREEHFFDNSSDSFNFKIKDIKKDTLLVEFKEVELYFKKAEH